MQTQFTPVMPSVNQALNGKASVTTSSQAVALGNSNTVVFTNIHASAIGHINWGLAAVAATVDDFPIMPGNQIIITRPPGATHFAVIGTASLTLHYNQGS